MFVHLNNTIKNRWDRLKLVSKKALSERRGFHVAVSAVVAAAQNEEYCFRFTAIYY